MPKLSDLVPINLASEKEKFFASNFKYNPQFIYQKNISKKELLKYGKPKLWYLFLAHRILKKYLKGRNLTDQKIEDKIFLDQDEVEDLIEERLGAYNLVDRYKIVFSRDFISRIAVNNNNELIKVRVPIMIDKNEIEAILNHEIDTHIIRQLNYEKQPWYKKKKSNAFRPYLRTEEGLAAVNELIASKHRLAYKSAVNYLAVDLALKKDFATVFNFFYKIWCDPERAWTWTLKKKRGVRDTSKGGAFTKDLVYFEGFMQVLHYLKKHSCNPSDLYYGKIDCRDINKAKKNRSKEALILPKTFTNNEDAYKKAVAEIIKSNLF